MIVVPVALRALERSIELSCLPKPSIAVEIKDGWTLPCGRSLAPQSVAKLFAGFQFGRVNHQLLHAPGLRHRHSGNLAGAWLRLRMLSLRVSELSVTGCIIIVHSSIRQLVDLFDLLAHHESGN